MTESLREDIAQVVQRVLAEDVGSGDLTAALIDDAAIIRGSILTRESMTLAGRPWVDAVFAALDPSIGVDWRHEDGDFVAADTVLCRIAGPAAAVLTGERSALNLLQTLSATATVTAAYAQAVAGTGCRILDTRKTLPGLRLAQKYAVRCGGGTNHRIGLFDAVLIKENHIAAAGGIAAAITRCRKRNPGVPVEIEVESLAELESALDAGVERVLLDNFSLDDLRAAVRRCARKDRDGPELEASGNVTLDTVRSIAETGVDYVSVGALTKHVHAVDLSMRFEPITSG